MLETEKFDVAQLLAEASTRRYKQHIQPDAGLLQVGEGLQIRADILRSSARARAYTCNRHYKNKRFIYHEKSDGTRWIIRVA